jgi:amino acid efflux transporter
MGELQKTLTVWRGTAMLLNIVLGAGLLTLPGLAAEAAGNGALFVWAACAIAAAPLLAIFGLLGRRFPHAGGLAAILRAGFGDMGYVAATLLFFGAVAFGLPAIALTGGYYAASILGGPAPAYALGLLAAAAFANVISAEIAGRVNAALASLLIFVLLAVAATGWFVVTPSSGTAVSAPSLPPLAVFGPAFMMVFFAFTGWEVGANLGGEFRNPRRDLPLAMAFSFVIAVTLYGVLALVVHHAGLASGFEAPFATIFGQAFGLGGSAMIAGISVLLIFANLSAAIWAVSRMVYAAAGERLLPAGLTATRAGMPWRAVLVTVAVLMTVTAAAWLEMIDLSQLLATAGLNFLLLYAGGAAVLFRLPEAGWHRVLAGLALLLVALLLAARGIDGLYYPAALIAIAALIASGRQARLPKNLEPGE